MDVRLRDILLISIMARYYKWHGPYGTLVATKNNALEKAV